MRFDTLTLKDAEQLAGKTVVATFTVAKPAPTWGEGKKLVTVIGRRTTVPSSGRSC